MLHGLPKGKAVILEQILLGILVAVKTESQRESESQVVSVTLTCR